MNPEEFEKRVEKLESSQEGLKSSVHELNTTIALLNQTVEIMAKNEEKRQQLLDRSVLFVVGGFISAVVAWVVRGGLGQ